MAIGYHESSGKWNMQVKLDGEMARVLKVDTGIPDTVEMNIPLVNYQNDREIELTVRRLTGDYAGVKEIIIYQYERPKHHGGPQSLTTGPVVAEFTLRQNYPNPFKSATTINYQLPTEAKVNLKIYNSLGQLVKTLVNKKQPTGNYAVRWDGKDKIGRKVTNGVYFYCLNTDNFTATKKLVILR